MVEWAVKGLTAEICPSGMQLGLDFMNLGLKRIQNVLGIYKVK